MENVIKFYEFLKNNSAAPQELQEQLKKTAVGDADAAITAIIEFAAQKGFVFTAEDLKQFEKESVKNLSDEELQQINAGAFGLCFTIGIGWGSATDFNRAGTDCYVIGYGIGLATEEVPTPEKNK